MYKHEPSHKSEHGILCFVRTFIWKLQDKCFWGIFWGFVAQLRVLGPVVLFPKNREKKKHYNSVFTFSLYNLLMIHCIKRFTAHLSLCITTAMARATMTTSTQADTTTYNNRSVINRKRSLKSTEGYFCTTVCARPHCLTVEP